MKPFRHVSKNSHRIHLSEEWLREHPRSVFVFGVSMLINSILSMVGLFALHSFGHRLFFFVVFLLVAIWCFRCSARASQKLSD